MNSYLVIDHRGGWKNQIDKQQWIKDVEEQD